MKLRIVPYKMGSKSAKLLAEKLSEKVGYRVLRSAVPKLNFTNLNWGTILHLFGEEADHINHPANVAVARDKIACLKTLAFYGIPHPLFTTNKEEAIQWINEGKTVLARTSTGQGGSGITVCDSSTGLVDAPLYTVYIKKRKEFRVHVINREVVFVQEKRKKVGEQPDPMIRSHKRGWVFCTKNIEEPEDLRKVAVDAVNALDLNFGGVDVIWNAKQNKCYVLEVNTAPGLSPQTAEIYATKLLGSQELEQAE